MEISLFELQGKKILRITTHRKGNREIDKNVEGINWKYTSMPRKMWLGFSTTEWYWLYNNCNSSLISL